MQRPRRDGLEAQAAPAHLTSSPRRAPKKRRRRGPNARGRRRQHIGYLVGLLLGLVLVILFFLPGQEHLHALGPMNTGHEALADQTYCSTCHQDTQLENDPITVSHEALIATADWGSCLGCHDYHGNHVIDTETVVYKALPAHEIEAYFEGGPSPYSDERYYQAKQEITDE